MRVVIASTGLGSVKRGIETWAEDMFQALIQEGADVHLAYGGRERIEGAQCHRIRCIGRNDKSAKILSAIFSQLGGWRYGWGSGYQIEQTTFVPGLAKLLKELDADILHVQDPWLAFLIQKMRHRGKIRTKTILAHGTEEDMGFLEKIDYLQELTPFSYEKHFPPVTSDQLSGKKKRSLAENAEGAEMDFEQKVTQPSLLRSYGGQAKGTKVYSAAEGREERKTWRTCLPAEATCPAKPWRSRMGRQGRRLGRLCARKIFFSVSSARSRTAPKGFEGQASRDGFLFMIPNFVNTSLFHPYDTVRKSELRSKYGIPSDAFVVGCVSAVKSHHKRIDYLIREFSVFSANSARNVFLLIAGSRCADTDELIALAGSLVPGRHKILLDFPHEKIPELLGMMDVFVLCSLFEMMPIAVLEALASGLPCIVNNHPVLEWIVGRDEGGELVGKLEGCKVEKLGERGAVIGYRLEVTETTQQLSNSPPKADPPPAETTLGSDVCIDMSKEGELAEKLRAVIGNRLSVSGEADRKFESSKVGKLTDNQSRKMDLRAMSSCARERAVKMFSWEAVYPKIRGMYEAVISKR